MEDSKRRGFRSDNEFNMGAEGKKNLPAISYNDFKAALKAGDLSRAVSVAQEIMKSKKRFDVAVIGKEGSDTLSFINAIRDLEHDYFGDLKNKQASSWKSIRPEFYIHPRDSQLCFWDMPKISGPDFKANKYLDQENFAGYDLFIIIASKCFINIHTELAEEIQRRGKTFYFVRSNVEKDALTDMNKEKALLRIREEYALFLQEWGLTDHKVFLISRRYDSYDFPLLKETLFNKIFRKREMERESEKEKLLVISQSALQEKKSEKTWPAFGKSVLEGGMAAVVWKGSFDEYDAAIVTDIVKGYYKEFGLDDDSLMTLAGHVGKDVKSLKAVMTCVQASEITSNHISDLLRQYTPPESKVLRYVPVLGGAFCMARTIGIMLRFLNEVSENANSVLREALRE